jgi:hypothetical protein
MTGDIATYEGEKEILLLPFFTFQVVKIEYREYSNNQHEVITLVELPY